MSFYGWKPYVPVAERRASGRKQMDKLRKKGMDIQPIEIEGMRIASSFWGKAWCDHLESFSDFDNRLPRGRAYVRNGSVCHLDVQTGRIQAFVSGSSLYTVSIEIKPLAPKTWKAIKSKCHGQIGSILELLQGRLSDHVMRIVCDRAQGLFPLPGEIQLRCSCPDWATMCKHVAAVLYGVGNRLDMRPELLFVLRGVDAEELIAADVMLSASAAVAPSESLAADGLADIFGVDIDTGETAAPEKPCKKTKKAKASPASKMKQQGRAAVSPAAQPLKTRGKKNASAKKNTALIIDPSALTGKSIAALRQRKGLSVTALAHILGVSVPSVYRWESAPGTLRLQARPLAALLRLQDDTAGVAKKKKTASKKKASSRKKPRQ